MKHLRKCPCLVTAALVSRAGLLVWGIFLPSNRANAQELGDQVLLAQPLTPVWVDVKVAVNSSDGVSETFIETNADYFLSFPKMIQVASGTGPPTSYRITGEDNRTKQTRDSSSGFIFAIAVAIIVAVSFVPFRRFVAGRKGYSEMASYKYAVVAAAVVIGIATPIGVFVFRSEIPGWQRSSDWREVDHVIDFGGLGDADRDRNATRLWVDNGESFAVLFLWNEGKKYVLIGPRSVKPITVDSDDFTIEVWGLSNHAPIEKAVLLVRVRGVPAWSSQFIYNIRRRNTYVVDRRSYTERLR